ncbi:coiled-coil domain-containing protein 187 isoform X2 [Colossoma macropomum]|uniref:coiled-coil domain-containing protein 187 isoform X2 n=1 Tax=Colossoma macropomum TaxID=42526 RepID=UPI0018646BD0|nr:coiled-coil domain-containing protein 187 isoform X2 [Colossoma macropomum]
MAELEVDQSSLPKVEEVEQYYSSNVQRSQLVQNDIRVAKRLQDEEQLRAHVLHRQATQQLEEQDSEYARRIQEELQRCAEEARRREEEDEEIAKRIQEEEELLVRQRTSCQRTERAENTAIPALRNALQPARPLVSKEEEQERYDWASHSRPYSPSPSTSDYEEDHCERRRHVSQDYGDGFKQRHRPGHEPPRRNHLGQECRSSVSQSSHLGEERRSSVSQSSHLEEDRKSSISQSSRTGRFQGGWGDVVQLIKNDLSEQGYLSCSSDDELFEPVYRLERIFSQRRQAPDQHGGRDKRLSRHSSVREATSRMWQGERVSRTQSFRGSEYSDSRSLRSEERQVRRYNSSCSDSRPGDGQRHVHFQDDARGHNRYNKSQRAFEGSHGGTRERELGSCTVGSYPVRGYSQVYLTTANGVQYQTHPQGFQQSAQVRNIRRGDFQVGSRARYNYGEFQQVNGVKYFENSPSQESRVREEEEEWERDSRRVRGEHRRRAHSLREERVWQATEIKHYHGNRRERRVWQGEEESSSTEEEEEERERRREERRVRRLSQRSLSLACRGRSPRAGSVLRRDGASLDLGELEQVLLDEELARRLQEQEEKLLRGVPQSTSHIQRSYPEGDFRVAQVAQDEEIARFMQKQEIRAKQQSQELDECGTGREYRQMTNAYDDSADYERQVQRDRLDSEGLLSPTEECSPEYQPPSPIAMATQQHQYRNIAEELDPTFHRKENLARQNISAPCQIQDTPEAGSLDLMGEPTFVPPTKRHGDKTVRVKSKEKKEHSKPKENCKQQ